MRLKLGEVELNELIVFCALVFLEFGSIFAGKVSDTLALGSLEIIIHSIVEGENRCCGTNFSTLLSDVSVDAELDGGRGANHIANRGHACSADAVDTRT